MYDNANRLTQVQQCTNTVTIGYDAADRRTSLTLPNGNSVIYAYDAASQLTSLTYKQGMTVIGDLTYTYDLAGNRIKQGEAFARTTIPPALSTVSYNANNQQITFGTNTETYDLNGNLATVTEAGSTATYTWNVRNQLTGISVTGFSASFTYDSFGRRTGKTVQGTTTNFVYDGLNPVQEKNGGAVTANLLTGLGIDEFFQRTDGVGTSALLPDALGSTVALGDNTGTLQTQYTYEPFGSATTSGTASSSSYKYTGREDDGTGLYYYRARYYHPRLQRFIAEDPIGFAGRDVNIYGYVRGNPVTRRDPKGLGPISFAGCTALNAWWQAHDFFSDLNLLEENTRMTRDMLARVDTEMSACPGDKRRQAELRNIRAPLELQLLKLTYDWGADITKLGLFQVVEGMGWEGLCALTLVPQLP